MPPPSNFQCDQCSAIMRELTESWKADTARLRSSGRDPVELRDEWLSSDEDRMRELYGEHYPRTIAARRRKTEHEVLTGHQVLLHGWRGIFGRAGR